MTRILPASMGSIEWFCTMLVGALGAAAGLWWSRLWRERQLRALPFSKEWQNDLLQNVPLYRKLPESLRPQLHGLIQVFTHTKRFEGAAGIRLTEAMRVRIAAEACLLLLNRKTRVYPRLRSIIVYPSSFTVPAHVEFSPGHYLAGSEERLGESWHTGAVVLSWQTIETEHRQPAGRNLVLHEFAHQLDMENGAADGIPALDHARAYSMWARALQAAYGDFRRRIEAGLFSPLPPYAARNEAEFFAVATELFFEMPLALKSESPEFYEQLSAFYRQDPEACQADPLMALQGR